MRDSIHIVKDTLQLANHSGPIQTITEVVHCDPNRDWLDFVDVFGGIASSILIFILGFFLSNLISKRKDKRKCKEYYNFFVEYLKQQQQSIDNQVVELEKTKLRMEEVKYHCDPELKMILQQFYVLDSFNKEQLMTAYKVVKKQPSELMDILHELEYARVLIMGIETSLLNYSNRQNELTDLLNVDLKQWDTLTRKDNQFLIEVVKQIDLNKLEALAKIELSLKEKKNTSAEMVLQYHIPTAKLLLEIDDKTPDPRLQEFIAIGRNMEHILKNKDLSFKHFKDRIDNAIEKLQGVSKNIQQ